ncbi:hypothetical protein [Arthrobacter psychrochitiniphilus]|uniref:Uncharacterized protein n=1 Tax=Arthrobacter psychrochitiniphilus TaxID=291045 RepID=A0A2V3DQW0_9MICC|nr:hypothetical protein [Arthrobacter psychrochitiniphilus]NYG17578.1 hypothetical protein [Arthrobacter psychrochitiniphilus]PXA64676.1 hypothetical protein CVS29_14070 [Arthrobacter psychrochitiniphilus]
MNASSTLRLPVFLLRWVGLITLAAAIVGGLLGMHVIGSAQAAPMASVHISTAAADVAGAPARAHPAASLTMSVADHDEVAAVASPHGNMNVCGCSPLGCEMPMASHGDCIPFAGAATPAAPQPGLVPDPAAGPTVSGHEGYKCAGRVPDPPSLTQLSISRT